MQNAHGYAWECRAPSHDPVIFEQEFEFQDHASKEHGVPEAHVGTLSGAARRLVPEKILECPFGDDFSALAKDELNTVFSNESLSLHVAAHMKEIALLALQKLPSDDDHELEDVASDAPLKDDGFAKLRGSMYSVLDDESLDFPQGAEDSVSKISEEGIASSVDRLDLEDKDATGIPQLQTEMDYTNVATDTSDELFDIMVDQNLLVVPGHSPPRNHDEAGTKRSSIPTMATPYTLSSDSPTDVGQEPPEVTRVKGGRQSGLRLPEADVQNVLQVREIGACIRCTVLRQRVSLSLL